MGPVVYPNSQLPQNSGNNNDRVGNNVAVMVQLSDGEVNASKATVGAGGPAGSSSVLSDMAVGTQSHGKHA